MTFRIATWNMQTMFPVRNDGKWGYVNDRVRPDIAFLTEARPDDEIPLNLMYRQGGLGKRRRWGTILAADPGLDVHEYSEVRHRFRTHNLHNTWPGSVVVADIYRGMRRLMTVVGVYAVTVDPDGKSTGSGHYTARSILTDLAPLWASRKPKRIVVGGDLNLWPNNVAPLLARTPLVDLVEATAGQRVESPDCVCEAPKPCHHIWTHNNSFKGKFQQLDYLFATPDLADRLVALRGGPDDFPDIWEWSDHAPLVAEFELD